MQLNLLSSQFNYTGYEHLIEIRAFGTSLDAEDRSIEKQQQQETKIRGESPTKMEIDSEYGLLSLEETLTIELRFMQCIST